ncbi:hypothetical protein J4Q44_G00175580 [Coregonus suidteri]|uniref:Uncharacterized protein n=1 Tax=Coregonus suidteri TaxID=861788 RepID=A0AAN8LLC5_9TELE
MGDDRVLGRLAKAYHSIEKRRQKHLILTKRVNLQIYYIPVTDEPIVNSPQSSHSRSSEPNRFLVDVLSYYLRCGLQPVHFTLYSVKISVSGQTGSPVEEVFVSHLEAEFPEFKTLRENLRQERSSRRRNKEATWNLWSDGFCELQRSEPKTLKIRILEDKTFTVCLDKDCRRKYTHVQSIEISPCLDPGYCLQTSNKSNFSVGEEWEAGLSRYLCKILPLPINTPSLASTTEGI